MSAHNETANVNNVKRGTSNRRFERGQTTWCLFFIISSVHEIYDATLIWGKKGWLQEKKRKCARFFYTRQARIESYQVGRPDRKSQILFEWHFSLLDWIFWIWLGFCRATFAVVGWTLMGCQNVFIEALSWMSRKNFRQVHVHADNM